MIDVQEGIDDDELDEFELLRVDELESSLQLVEKTAIILDDEADIIEAKVDEFDDDEIER